jgi:hypothetical protein
MSVWHTDFSRRSSSRSQSFWSSASSEEASQWMQIAIWIGFAALAVVFASGCGRTVLVSDGSPMRIGRETVGRVYTRQGGEWVLSPDRVEIPEGWYVVPPRFVEENER